MARTGDDRMSASRSRRLQQDFVRMFKIIKDSGFKGWVSIEYEGGLFKMYTKDSKYLDDYAGTSATKSLVEKAGRMA